MRSNNLSQAAQLARHALDQGHVHPLLFDLRGCWKKSNGLLKEALDDLQRAHALAPGSAKILCDLAECLNGLGRHKLAIMACGDALAIDDSLAAAWFHKAFAHQMLNQPDQARDCYRETIHRKPDMAAAHARLANIHALQGRNEEARAAAGRALALDACDVIAMTALARADIAQGRLADAERWVSRLIDSDDPDLKSIALGFLGDLRDAQNRTREAFEAYRAAGAFCRAAHTRRAPFGQESGSDQIRRVTRVLKVLPVQAWGAQLR
jgi:tetratricopeptide (TPR) repeat protein